MQVEIIGVDKLLIDPSNARKHNRKNLDLIKASITKYGIQKPIVIDKKNIVVAGNGFLEAAKELGLVEIPCVRSELEGIDRAGYAIVDNRSNELSDWDFDALAELKADLDLEELGFDLEDLDLGDIEPNTKPDYETMPKEMDPIFSYYGGKQRLVSKLLPLIPKHTVFVEPFCGGATVFFAKPWPDVTNNNDYREVLNDTNQDVFNFYKCLQDKEKAEKLIHRLEFTLYSRDEHKLAQDRNNELDEFERAAMFYVDVSMSFSNIIGSGWGTGVYSCNLASKWSNKVSKLKDYLERMQVVHIENDDAIACIKRWDSPQTFFYCDPPYVGTDQGHYKGYAEEHFKQLCETLDQAQGSFLLSSYANEFTEKHVKSDWKRFDFESYCSAIGRVGGDKSKKFEIDKEDLKRVETVWKRLNKTPVREEIQELYDSGKYDCFIG